jgi:hypothetical protein
VFRLADAAGLLRDPGPRRRAHAHLPARERLRGLKERPCDSSCSTPAISMPHSCRRRCIPRSIRPCTSMPRTGPSSRTT